MRQVPAAKTIAPLLGPEFDTAALQKSLERTAEAIRIYDDLKYNESISSYPVD